jgi:hypothetical protein
MRSGRGGLFSKGGSMAAATTKLSRLERAGVLKSAKFSDKDKGSIEKLSEAEVTLLIKMRKKRGAAPTGKHHLRPNVLV